MQNNTPNKQNDVLEPEILDDAAYERARQAERYRQFDQSGHPSSFDPSSDHLKQAGHSGQSNRQGFTYFIRTNGGTAQGGNGGHGGNPNGFYRNYAFASPQNSSCLPSFISLFLVLLVFFQLGFLAMLGFIFFLIVGKALSFMVLFKNLINGKLVPPILLDVVVWIVSYSLVAWLA